MIHPWRDKSVYALIGALIVLAASWPVASANAEKRFALLIGNQGYNDQVGPLLNPHKDIDTLSAALEQLGFEIEEPVRDASFGEIRRAVNRYGRKLHAAGEGAIGFFYYAGHGVAVGRYGENFLLPADIPDSEAATIEAEGVSLHSDVVDRLNQLAPEASHFVIFDACRTLRHRGALSFAPVLAKPGMWIAFSTSPGDTASDGGDEGGPYALALADELVRSGLDQHEVFFNTRKRVSEATLGHQVPWINDGMLVRHFLAGKSTKADVRRARQIVLFAEHEIDNKPELAVLLALEALTVARGGLQQTSVRAAEEVLDRASRNNQPQLILPNHEDRVYSASFSPNGTQIVTASKDGTARIWDATSGAQIAILKGRAQAVLSVSFSPDGTRVVTSHEDGTARVWDAASGAQIAILKRHKLRVWHASFSPDGMRIVTASWDKTARVWDAANGAQIAVLEGHGDEVRSASFSPDGTRIVTASEDRTARVWDVVSGAQITILEGHGGEVRSASFSLDGTRIVTASWDKTARVWDAASGAQIAILKGHDNFLTSASFSPDGTWIVTASDDWTARVWYAADGAQRAILKGHAGAVRSASFSPDGRRIVTASFDGTARVWDVASGTEISILKGHEDFVTGASFSQDGKRIVTASFDGTVRVWDAASAALIATLETSVSTTASLSPDGTRIVTPSLFGTVRVWDAASGVQTAVLKANMSRVRSASFSPDGKRIVTASEDGTARVWDAASGAQIAILRGHRHKVWNASFSPDGARIVTASWDNTARVWSVGQPLVDNAKRQVSRCLTRKERERFALSPEPPSWCVEMGKWPYNARASEQ